MRKMALAGVATVIAALGIGGSVSAAVGRDVTAENSGAAVTPVAWRGGFGPRFHGGVFFGPSFGFGLYAPLWAPPPVYYAPPPVVVERYAAPAAPPAYAPPADGMTNGAYWYYCNNPQGYYPYVRMCNGAWQTVPANPEDGAPR